jgi:hypothetical protein
VQEEEKEEETEGLGLVNHGKDWDMKLTGLSIAAALASLVAAPAAAATDWPVNSTLDSGAGSLRNAIDAAGDGDTVTILPSVDDTIATNTPLVVDDDITIRGAGRLLSNISALGTHRAFIIHNTVGTVTFEDLSILSGQAPPGAPGGQGGAGGGILSEADTLILHRTAMIENRGGDGGDAVVNNGDGGDAGGGGAIYATGAVAIEDSLLVDNAAGEGGQPESVTGDGGDGGNGGAIQIAGSGSLQVVRSRLTNNDAGDPGVSLNAGEPGGGGAVHSSGDSLLVENSTLSANSPGSYLPALADRTYGPGAAILDSSNVGAAVTNATIAGNHGNAVASRGPAALRLRNSLLVDNVEVKDVGFDVVTHCGGTDPLVDDGQNMIFPAESAATCPATFTLADPLLQPAAANGGPTATQALGAGSPAIDAVPTASCASATDQRGLPRPSGAACDIGAFEVQVAPVVPPAPQPVPQPTPVKAKKCKKAKRKKGKKASVAAKKKKKKCKKRKAKK